MTASRSFLLALALTMVASSALAADPTAEEKETARALMEKGHAAYDAGKYQDALKPFADAHALMGVPTTGLWLANTKAKLGMLVDARELALEVSRMAAKQGDPPAFAAAR